MKVHKTIYLVQIWHDEAWTDLSDDYEDVDVAEKKFNRFVNDNPNKKLRLVQIVSYIRSIKEKL